MKGLDESELEKEQDNELLGIDDYVGVFLKINNILDGIGLKSWRCSTNVLNYSK